MVTRSTTKIPSVSRTSKGRLRHENSQLEFEPIISSPAHLTRQESQVLTERQREVYERQTRLSNVYADVRLMSPPPGPVAVPRSPLEFHSDALSADDLPVEASRTPLRNVRALGPMEIFVGSSPTPQARNRSQAMTNSQTSVSTPTAVRTIQFTRAPDDLGSSPPRFEKGSQSSIRGSRVEDSMMDTEQHRHEDERFGGSSMSFDDGTTIDEGAFLTGTPDEDPDASDMPSSTLDLQLTAQLDAEIQAQTDAASKKGPRQSLSLSDQDLEKRSVVHVSEGEDTEVDLPTKRSLRSNTEIASTSRVGDSFSSQAAEKESSPAYNLRRSKRHTSTDSPQSVNAKKRKASSGKGKNKTRESPGSPLTTTPRAKAISVSESASPSPTHAGSTAVVPDTTRVRSLRRSASSLSQVENQSEIIVIEDTPAPKRARRNIDKDVSEAKQSTRMSSQQTTSQRLSHVQATPRHSDARSVGCGSSGAVEEASVERANEPGPTVSRGNSDVTGQLPETTPSAVPGLVVRQSQGVSNSVATPSRSFAERVFLTPRSIIDKLKEFKDALFGAPQLALNRQEEREADDLMFEIRRAVHAAGARGGEPKQ